MDCMVIYLKLTSIKLSFNFNLESFYNEHSRVKIRLLVKNYVKKYIIGHTIDLSTKMVFVSITPSDENELVAFTTVTLLLVY